jgi:hypothetical protein
MHSTDPARADIVKLKILSKVVFRFSHKSSGSWFIHLLSGMAHGSDIFNGLIRAMGQIGLRDAVPVKWVPDHIQV